MTSEITVAAAAKISETRTEPQYFGSEKTVSKLSQPTHWFDPPNGGSSVTAQ